MGLDFIDKGGGIDTGPDLNGHGGSSEGNKSFDLNEIQKLFEEEYEHYKRFIEVYVCQNYPALAYESEDIAQGVLTNCWKGISEFRGDREAMWGWIRVCTNNFIISKYRFNRTRKDFTLPGVDREGKTIDAVVNPDMIRRITELEVKDKLDRMVNAFLDTQINEKHKQFFLLSIDGNTPLEIANLLQVNDSTVRVTRSRMLTAFVEFCKTTFGIDDEFANRLKKELFTINL
jgi:RNA polymerase sigma factor (sigma-70 family)